MPLWSRTLVAAAACLLLPLTSTAPSAAAAEQAAEKAAAMPTVFGPAEGVTEHDAATPVSVWYAGSFYGRYALIVTCVSAPGAEPLRWVDHHRWYGSFRQEKQEFRPDGQLPPNATCTAVVRRAADRAETEPVDFTTVWGEGVLHLEQPPAATLWPAPEDGGQRLSWVLHVREPGSYGISISGSDGNDFVDRREFGDVGPGRYAWTWDATRSGGTAVAEGRYTARADGRYQPDGAAEQYVDTPDRSVVVRYATDTVTSLDRHRERGSRHVDVASYTLANGPDQVSVGYRFRSLRRQALTSLRAGLDVDRAERGYLLTVGRDRRGRLRPTLALAHLASDVGRPRPVRCGGLDLDLTRRAATVTVPRTCLDRGGRKVRAYYAVTDRHHHYDSGPERRRALWTPWAVYETPPR